jgi:hypothetical protein
MEADSFFCQYGFEVHSNKFMGQYLKSQDLYREEWQNRSACRAKAFTFTLSAKGKPGDSRAGNRKPHNGGYDYEGFHSLPRAADSPFPPSSGNLFPPKGPAFTA